MKRQNNPKPDRVSCLLESKKAKDRSLGIFWVDLRLKEQEKMEVEGKKVAGNGGQGNTASEVAALKKCLEENKGDRAKCKSQIEALKSAVVSPEKRALSPLRLRTGSLTEV
ncbi:PREDICTED: uncharacterized protein LOC109184741 [Ipomoea nil]|uniref:uncharacterized protein LOC109184741 n=1 Tax=Ipomoea nil TaxID=35883 RepID=UPI000901872C|nr:PREDICTED: uncharacterized protein LOC109184741 [Ipomoea nil]